MSQDFVGFSLGSDQLCFNSGPFAEQALHLQDFIHDVSESGFADLMVNQVFFRVITATPAILAALASSKQAWINNLPYPCF